MLKSWGAIMGLESLLATERRPALVTPVTPSDFQGLQRKPLQTLAVPLVTPVTPQKCESRKDAIKAGATDAATAAHWRWLIYFSDRDPLEVATVPPSTRSEMLESYPDAIAAEPFAAISQRPPAWMSAGDEAAVRAWLEHSGEADAETVADVLRQCQRDAEARRYFIGRAAAVQSAVTRSCMTCRDFARPGLSSGYCGGGRADLLPAYGDHHPLRQLPEDGGASCEEWRDYA